MIIGRALFFRLLFAGFSTFLFVNLDAQLAKTFLYRITGNGLSKPSFLYGTIHLQDSRLFNFQDSLYSYIRQSDVFAMEVDPDSITEKAVEYYDKKEKRVTLGEQLSKEAMERVKKKYQYLTKNPIENMTLVEVLYESQEQYKRKEGKDKMVTFMDMYLMGIAKDWGKSIKGLENIEDQMVLFEKITNGKDPESVLAGLTDKSRKKDALITAYLNQDMQTVAGYVSSMPPEIETVVLSNRNKVMLGNMESIMKEKTLFAAVGAAHLPGKEGLIQLLQEKGYSVTPELSAARTHANNFNRGPIIEKGEWKKVVVEKDGYEVYMPGMPAKNTIAESGTDMYTYIDWQHGEYYYSMHMISQIKFTAENRDSLMKEILKRIGSNMTGKNNPEITTASYPPLSGYELSVPGPDKKYYRTIVLNKEDEIVMLMVGMGKMEDLKSDKAEKFFASLKLIPRKMEDFAAIENKDHGFSVSMPGKPSYSEDEGQSDASGFSQYYSKQGLNEFLMLVSFCKNGYVYENDSIAIEAYRNVLDKNIDTVLVSNKGLMEGGYPFFEEMYLSKSGKMIRGKYVMRGNRMYTQYHITNKDDYNQSLSDTFFSSFSIKQIPDISVKYYFTDSVRFVTLDSTLKHPGDPKELDSSIFYIYHKPTASTLTILSEEINKHAWGITDSAFLYNTIIRYIPQKDYTIQKVAYTAIHGKPAVDVEFTYPYSHQIVRWKFIKAGNRLFKLTFPYAKTAASLASVNELFDSFLVTKKYPVFDLKKGSAAGVFKYVDTCSKENFEVLADEFVNLPFSKEDLPLLIEKSKTKHPGDTVGYNTLEDNLWKVIKSLVDTSDVPWLSSQWGLYDSLAHFQTNLLETIAELNTPAAMAAIKNLMPKLDESEPYTGRILGKIEVKKENVAGFFPEWYQYITKLKIGPSILHVYHLAADSGWISEEPENFKQLVLELGDTALKEFSKSEHGYISFESEIIEALKRIKTPEANRLLTKLATEVEEDEYFRYQAVIALIDNKEEPTALIEEFCAKPDWRGTIYYNLKEKNKLGLFPAKYQNQQSMAEAFLYDNMEDYYPDTIESIGFRRLKYSGKEYLFYIFKCGFETESGMEYYLGVSGPFDSNGKNWELPESVNQVAGTMSDIFAKGKIEKQLKEFIKEYEEYEMPPEIDEIKE